MNTENMSIELKESIESFKERFKDYEFVSVDRYVDEDEHGYVNGVRNGKPDDITIEQIINYWTHTIDDSLIEWFNEIVDFKKLAYNWNDFTDGYSSLFVKQEYEEKLREQTRKALEGSAASFAAKHKTNGVNLMFLNLLQQEIERIEFDMKTFNDPEAKLERMGRNKSSFYDDQEYENNKYYEKIDRLLSIQEYVRENLPLLWARYQEANK